MASVASAGATADTLTFFTSDNVRTPLRASRASRAAVVLCFTPSGNGCAGSPTRRQRQPRDLFVRLLWQPALAWRQGTDCRFNVLGVVTLSVPRGKR